MKVAPERAQKTVESLQVAGQVGTGQVISSPIINTIPSDVSKPSISPWPTTETTMLAQFNHHSVALPGKKRILKDGVTEVCEAFIMTKRALAEGGQTLSEDGVIAIAVEASRLTASRDQEQRHYIYDSTQRHVDRCIKERHQREHLAAGKQDKDWFQKVQSEYTKTTSALISSVFTCLLGTVLISVCAHLRQIYFLWQQASYYDLICGDNHAEIIPSVIDHATSSSWEIINHYYYRAQFELERISECFSLNVARLLQYGGIFLAVYLCSWLLDCKLLNLPHGVRQTVASFVLVVFLSFEELISVVLITRLVFCLGVSALVAFVYLKYQFGVFKQNMKKKNDSVPSVAQVNECLEWFGNAADFLRMTPLVAVGVWGLMISFDVL